MAVSADLKRENEALRRRSATLNAAILRINASLDLDTVLGEVVESARALTGARWGVIATVDEAGTPRDFVFSGFTPEEQQALFAWPDSARLFAHFRELPGPLRLDDLSAYVLTLGIEPAPAFSRTFQGTPMRHHGADVGSFFLADKADGKAFTDEDEEVLTLFVLPGRVGDRQRAHPPGRAACQGPISRHWWRPPRSGCWCSTRRAAVRCLSTAKRGGSGRACACRDGRPSSSWR